MRVCGHMAARAAPAGAASVPPSERATGGDKPDATPEASSRARPPTRKQSKAILPPGDATEINLWNSKLDEEAAKRLARELEGDTRVKSLNLDYNKVGAAGAVALAEMLTKNSTLQKLCLDGNDVGLEGAQAFAAALRKNQTLRTLSLSWNAVGPAGAAAIAEAVEENQTLQSLNLTFNALGRNQSATASVKAITSKLDKNTDLYFGDVMAC